MHDDPPWMTLARAEVGVKERDGAADHPRIIEYLRSVRLPEQLVHDTTPWCAAFVGWCMKQSGRAGTGKANARSWLTWGVALDEPRPGCVVVLWRKTRSGPHGHVAFFVRNGGDKIWLLGGNQSNAVGITPYPRGRVLGYRWPSENAVIPAGSGSA